MASVTIAKPYFDALLRRADFRTSGPEIGSSPNPTDSVTISRGEHEYLLQASRDFSALIFRQFLGAASYIPIYNVTDGPDLLKDALFRGGLTTETLETLLAGESGGSDEQPTPYVSKPVNYWSNTFARPPSSPITIPTPGPDELSPNPENTAIGDCLQPRILSHSYSRRHSYSHSDSDLNDPSKYNESQNPVYGQRSILISNLSDRTTHKDLIGIIRGGSLLDIYLRNDRTAVVSFTEGAADFLAYTKRKDVYLHMKRLEFRWNDRQFHVPQHVSNKIANGASRNLVVRGAARKFTADEIRDHLDHIHNLVVVDIFFRNGDVYVSTNSIHNALFARTCMMSRTAYKGLRIEWYPDECAVALPRPTLTLQPPVSSVPVKPRQVSNPYSLLDTGSDLSSDSEDSSLSNGVALDHDA